MILINEKTANLCRFFTLEDMTNYRLKPTCFSPFCDFCLSANKTLTCEVQSSLSSNEIFLPAFHGLVC